MPTLYTRLPADEKQTINQTLDYVKNEPPLSAEDLKAILIEAEKNGEKTNNLYFKAIAEYLWSVESNKKERKGKYTYLIKNDMTVGIGLDLTKGHTDERDDCLALLCSAMPNYDWLDIYPRMLKEEGRPNKKDHEDFSDGLSADQMEMLLFYTLIGASYFNSEKNKTEHYRGVIYKLIDALTKDEYELANKKFLPHQLISLLCLIYHGPLIGPGMRERLQDLLATGYDGEVLLEILEDSNKEYSNGFQNRLLQDVGVFGGYPDKVALTITQFNALVQNNPDLKNMTVIGGDASPFVMDKYEASYSGNEGFPVTIKGANNHPQSGVYFGTNTDQTFSITGNQNTVVFAGNGNNEITVTTQKGGDSHFKMTYLAANNGVNNYHLHNAGHVYIYDEKGLGQINYWIGSEKISVSGLAICQVEDDDTFYFYSSPSTSAEAKLMPYYYNGITRPILRLRDDEEDNHDVSLFNYDKNQFNITLAKFNKPVLFADYNALTVKPKRLTSGLYVGLMSTRDQACEKIVAHIYDQKGSSLRQFTIDEVTFDNENINGWLYLYEQGLDVLNDNTFVLAYGYEKRIYDPVTKTTSGFSLVKNTICSPSSVIKQSQYEVDMNASAAPSVVANGQNYLTLYKLRWADTEFKSCSINANGHEIEHLNQDTSILSAAGLKDGNFVALARTGSSQNFIIYLLSPAGQLLNKLNYQSTFIYGAVSPVSDSGFLLTTASSSELETIIFDGKSWGTPLKINSDGHYISSVENVAYLNNTFVSVGSGVMYFINDKNQLLRANGGYLPISCSKPDDKGIITSETKYQRDAYPRSTLMDDWEMVEKSSSHPENTSWLKTMSDSVMMPFSTVFGMFSRGGSQNHSAPINDVKKRLTG